MQKETSQIKKIFYILDKRDKTILLFIFIASLISSVFDLIGISAVLPIVTTLVSSSTTDSWYISLVANLFKLNASTQRKELVVVLILLLAAFYIVKAIYQITLNYVKSRYNASFNRRISVRMIKTYLAMPYEFHLQNNSSTLLRSATNDVSSFSAAMNSFISIMMQSLTSVLIVAYLIYSDISNGTVTTPIVGGIVLVCSLFIVLFLRKRTRTIGYEIQNLNGESYKYINQAFSGIKESKITNTEPYFAQSYHSTVIAKNKLDIKYNIYQTTPPLLLETLGLVAFLIALLVSVLLKGTDPSIVTGFSVLALAVIRLLPAASNINSNINYLSYTKSSVDLLYHDLKRASEMEEVVKNMSSDYQKLPFENEIEVSNVSFNYKGTEKIVLNDVSFKVKKGQSIAISGVSGAGKTTMVDILLGLLSPTEGKVCCDGLNIANNPKGWHENISYIPQVIYLMDDTIRSNVAFGIPDNQIFEDKIWDSLEKAQLKSFVESLPNGLDTVIGERGVRLSGGQRQRIGIARALYRGSQIMVFDEATNALDYETESAILDHVSSFKGEHTVIIITHRLNTIENCDAIYKIENGHLSQVK